MAKNVITVPVMGNRHTVVPKGSYKKWKCRVAVYASTGHEEQQSGY